MALKGYTNTYSELLHAMNGAGSANTGTTAAGTATLLNNRSSTYPLPVLDAGYFAPQYGVAKTVLIEAQGVISFASAATTQTLVVGVAYATSDTATIGTSLAATGTVTPAATQAVTTAIWNMKVYITATTVGSAGAMQAIGVLQIWNTAPTLGTLAGTMGVGVGGTATVAMNTEQANYLQVYSTWGATNTSASNTMTMYNGYVWALN